MPANFPQSNRNTLTALNAVTGGATTFADRIVSVINSFFGASNPFGTAATRDTGTGDGNVPVLDSTGKVNTAVLGAASTTRAGVVQIAASLAGAAAGTVPTAAQVSAESARLATIVPALDISRIQVRDMTSNFNLTSGSGFIIASGGTAATGGATQITFTRSDTNTLLRISVAGSILTLSNPSSQLEGTFVTNTVRRGSLVFDIRMAGKGIYHFGADVDAELYIAFVDNIATFQATAGAAATGRATGFAYFLQLA